MSLVENGDVFICLRFIYLSLFRFSFLTITIFNELRFQDGNRPVLNAQCYMRSHPRFKYEACLFVSPFFLSL